MKTIADYSKQDVVANIEQAIAKAKAASGKNAFLHITEQRALERAAKVASGEITGRLAGVPFAVKDNFMTFDGPSTAASHMLENYHSPVQAEAVERLEAEGAICIGKTNLDAFAHGGSTENSAFGPTKNALDDQRVAGGSSGGSAVVTALDIVPFALGSDTGGSIRQPASFNGVFGIKPTYGMVSRYGVVAMASSTDTVGCFAGTADDLTTVMDIIAGQDKKDMTTLDDYFQPSDVKPLKIGVVKQFLDEGVDAEVKQATYDYIEELKAAGHQVDDIDLPLSRYALPIYYIVMSAEVSSNLSRYDGVHYGSRSPEAKSLSQVYQLSRNQGFMPENKRRIMLGSYVLSSGYFDAYYLKAAKVRTLLIESFDKAFEEFDVLVGPVAPTPAYKLGENIDDPLAMYMADVLTAPASVAGLPALSVPAGTSSTGLPIGVQLIGQRQTDSQLLALAKQLEGAIK